MEKYNIRIDRENPEPKFRQVADGIKALLERGILSWGDYLPGERSLAKHLDVSRDVVYRAYKALGDEGLLEYANHKGHRLIKDPANPVEFEEKREYKNPLMKRN